MKKRLLMIMAVSLMALMSTGCSKNMAAAQVSDVEKGEIDVYNLTTYCFDGVKYLKYLDDEQMGTTVKFNRDGSVDTNCTEEEKIEAE